MSETKLNIKEETSAKKTRSPPKKAKVEQSVGKRSTNGRMTLPKNSSPSPSPEWVT